jgi:hypothetical protein
MKRAALLLVVAACLTQQDVRKYQCEVACRLGGWETGTYADEQCYCMDRYPFAEFIGTAIASAKLPKIKRVIVE